MIIYDLFRRMFAYAACKRESNENELQHDVKLDKMTVSYIIERHIITSELNIGESYRKINIYCTSKM